MSWQKARKIGGVNIGREFWVKIGPPITKSAVGYKSRRLQAPEPRFETNMLSPVTPNKCLVVRARYVELLPYFADAVDFETLF